MAAAPSSLKQAKQNRRTKAVKEGKQREVELENGLDEQESGDPEEAPKQIQQDDETWPFVRLSEHQGSSSLPAVFSKDGRFCFVACGSSVKIYSVETCQVVSSLNAPASSSSVGNNQVTALFLNPSNSLQLVVTSLDGCIRIWDYLDGRVLRTVEMGSPITLATLDAKQHDTIFVGLLKASEKVGRASKIPSTVIYQVSLKRTDARKVRLGKCRSAFTMAVSSDGRHLVILSRKRLHIASLPESTTSSASTSTVTKEIFISFDGTGANDVFTSLAMHPSESYFATGDSKGQIRFWYILDPSVYSNFVRAANSPKPTLRNLPKKFTSTIHWHAHAVASLHFTPNGAYLLSGGEEAVLVAWQLQSRHKEFVPRLGASIGAISIVSAEGREQEFVLRLKDGAIVFVAAGTLKVVRSIAGVKSISDVASARADTPLPLAVEPITNNLVFVASHPSSLQFFSPSLNTHVYELEVSPSNRVSRTDERVIEPTRVERVAFSQPALQSSGSGTVWMATFDTWQDRDYARESHLKFWLLGRGRSTGYALNTRIDQPHGTSRVTSLAFSNAGDSTPTLVTTALDGSIKLWVHRLLDEKSPRTRIRMPDGAWQCRSAFSYRGKEARDAAFSPDGSLLAIAHVDGVVTLWETGTGDLVKALTSSGLGKVANKVRFVGQEGTRLVAGGSKGSVVWDVLTCEEILSLPLASSHLLTSTSDTSLDSFVSIRRHFPDAKHSQASTVKLNPADATLETHQLAFPVSEVTSYPSTTNTLAAITEKGELVLTGSDSTAFRASLMMTTSETAANLRALDATNQNQDHPATRRVRLFDEIFGPSLTTVEAEAEPEAGAGARPAVSTPAGYAQAYAVEGRKGAGEDVFALMPSHALPSVASLWRGLMGPQLRPLLSNRPGRMAKTKTAEGQSDDDDEEDETEQERLIPMEVDEVASANAVATTTTVEYVDSSPASLQEIFARTLALGHGSEGKGSGSDESASKEMEVAKDRMAGLRQKSPKKKRSLAEQFGA